MAVDVVAQRIINRPRAAVAAFAADPDKVPRWYANIASVEWLSPRPMELGTRLAFVAHFLGRRLAYTYEVVDFRPGEGLAMRTTQGPFPMETSYAWEDAPGGATRMILRNRGEPMGFSRLVAPFMAAAIRAANRKDLKKLGEILETAVDP